MVVQKKARDSVQSGVVVGTWTVTSLPRSMSPWHIPFVTMKWCCSDMRWHCSIICSTHNGQHITFTFVVLSSVYRGFGSKTFSIFQNRNWLFQRTLVEKRSPDKNSVTDHSYPTNGSYLGPISMTGSDHWANVDSILHQNKKRRVSGNKCHPRTMIHIKSINPSKWTHTMCRSGRWLWK